MVDYINSSKIEYMTPKLVQSSPKEKMHDNIGYRKEIGNKRGNVCSTRLVQSLVLKEFKSKDF